VYTGSAALGPAGSGWDIPISFMRIFSSTMRRKPTFPSLYANGPVDAAHRVIVSIGGSTMQMVPTDIEGTFRPHVASSYSELRAAPGSLLQWHLDTGGASSGGSGGEKPLASWSHRSERQGCRGFPMAMNDRLDVLREKLRVSVPPAVVLALETVGGVNRLKATRRLDDGSERYLVITRIGSPDTPLGLDVFSILGGWYRNQDPSRDTDGRQWGSADHTLQIAIQWLVELVDDWPSLPPTE
jgi:hypothetical protein